MSLRLPIFATEPLLFAPGERWSYSNEGFETLGAIIEARTGVRYNDYIRQHVLLAAGMQTALPDAPADSLTDRAIPSPHQEDDYFGVRPRTTASRGWNAGGTGYGNQNRPMDREGGLHGRNSWSDGAWTADAADRLDRDVDLGGNRGSDTSPFHAGWYGPQGRDMGGRDMGRGYDSGYQGGGMNQGGLGRDRGWNLGTGDAEWGHNWGRRCSSATPSAPRRSTTR